MFDMLLIDWVALFKRHRHNTFRRLLWYLLFWLLSCRHVHFCAFDHAWFMRVVEYLDSWATFCHHYIEIRSHIKMLKICSTHSMQPNKNVIIIDSFYDFHQFPSIPVFTPSQQRQQQLQISIQCRARFLSDRSHCIVKYGSVLVSMQLTTPTRGENSWNRLVERSDETEPVSWERYNIGMSCICILYVHAHMHTHTHYTHTDKHAIPSFVSVCVCVRV